jgi:hypothetical protein
MAKLTQVAVKMLEAAGCSEISPNFDQAANISY